MTEIHVYHLQRQTLEAVLPTLLLRADQRGWRSLVKVASPERMAALDDHLWTFADESFLPHGTDRDSDPAGQPVLLTQGDANRNGAAMLFLVEGAPMPEDVAAFARVALLLDGHDESAVAAARETWRRSREAGHAVTYWQQGDDGRWTRRA